MGKDNTKYGLLINSPGINIGDEIQAIAARRFLPRVDYYINREKLSTFKPKAREKVKMIMNGWYLHDAKAWPPSDFIDPLLVSMHVNHVNKDVVKAFVSEKSQKFLGESSPVGARDLNTLNIMKRGGIDAYFSACLTLTLQRNETRRRQDYVLAIDVSDEVLSYIKARTKRPVHALYTYINTPYTMEERFYSAEYFLDMYQNAHCMITSRLHAALPALAFETPVLLLKDRERFFDDLRFSGLIELLRSVEVFDFLSGSSGFDIEKPIKNSIDYLPFREALAKRCIKFTGFDNKSERGFSQYDFGTLDGEPFLRRIIEKSFHDVLILTAEKNRLDRMASYQEKAIADLAGKKAELECEVVGLENKVAELLKSTSWKVTKPIRKLKVFTDNVSSRIKRKS